MNSNDFCKNIPNLVSSFIDPDRLIAVGDLHGDLSKAQQALRLAGLIDAGDRWSGGSSTLVQVGDVLDKGGEELKLLYFLEKLKRQAVKDGGNVITMNGNHEIMNVDRCLHSTAPSGLQEFRNWAYWYTTGNMLMGQNRFMIRFLFLHVFGLVMGWFKCGLKCLGLKKLAKG
ncbi:putative protein-tyrosine-phosphatase [Helianthus debilis subsp. tardiflorus]